MSDMSENPETSWAEDLKLPRSQLIDIVYGTVIGTAITFALWRLIGWIRKVWKRVS